MSEFARFWARIAAAISDATFTKAPILGCSGTSSTGKPAAFKDAVITGPTDAIAVYSSNALDTWY